MSRRVAFLVMMGALFLFCFLHIYSKFSQKRLIVIFISLICIVTWFANKYVFTDLKSLDWAHMIQPRLNIYSSALKQLMEAGPIGIMFGSADGWAWYHNTYLDILTHSGAAGVSLVALCLHQLFKVYYQQYKKTLQQR